MPMDIRTGITQAASALGMSPVDLATIISYETGGTFDPGQQGPQGHRGLIQFGGPEAAQYGVNWNDAAGSQLGPNGAIVRYFKDRGYKPGMSLDDAYSIVNAGTPGRMNAVDNGTTVAQKVASMGPHRAKASAFLGGSFGGKASAGGPGGGTATGEAATVANSPPDAPVAPTPPNRPDFTAYNAAVAQRQQDPFSQLASTLAGGVARPGGNQAQMAGGDYGSEQIAMTPVQDFASAAPPPGMGHRPWDAPPEISTDTTPLADLFKVRQDIGQARMPAADSQGQPIIRRMRG